MEEVGERATGGLGMGVREKEGGGRRVKEDTDQVGSEGLEGGVKEDTVQVAGQEEGLEAGWYQEAMEGGGEGGKVREMEVEGMEKVVGGRVVVGEGV